MPWPLLPADDPFPALPRIPQDLPRPEGDDPTIGGRLLSGLEFAGASLDKALGGRAVRGILGNRPWEIASIIPFSDTLGLTDYSDVVTGRDLVEHYGLADPNQPGLDWGDVAGFGAEVVLDPATYVTGGLGSLTKGGKAIERAGSLVRASSKLASEADDAARALAAAQKAAESGTEAATAYARRMGLRKQQADAALEAARKAVAETSGKTHLAPKLSQRIDAGEASLAEIGIPFTNIRKPIGTGEKSVKFAEKYLDPIGDWWYYGPIAQYARPALDSSVKGEFGHRMTPDALKIAEEATRGQLEREGEIARQMFRNADQYGDIREYAAGRTATPGEEILQRAGFTPDDIASMDPERKTALMRQALLREQAEAAKAASKPTIKVDPEDAGRMEPPNTLHQQATPEDMRRLDSLVSNTTGYRDTFGVEKHRPKLAAHDFGHEVINSIPPGSEFLGAGNEALVFRAPDGNVIRVAVSPNAPRFPDPNILEPLRVQQFGDIPVETLPYAQEVPYGEWVGGIGDAMRQSLKDQGLFVDDLHRGNVGRVGDEIKVIDPTAVRRPPNTLHQQAADNLGALKSRRRDLLNQIRDIPDSEYDSLIPPGTLPGEQQTILESRHPLHRELKQVEDAIENLQFGAGTSSMDPVARELWITKNSGLGDEPRTLYQTAPRAEQPTILRTPDALDITPTKPADKARARFFEWLRSGDSPASRMFRDELSDLSPDWQNAGAPVHAVDQLMQQATDRGFWAPSEFAAMQPTLSRANSQLPIVDLEDIGRTAPWDFPDQAFQDLPPSTDELDQIAKVREGLGEPPKRLYQEAAPDLNAAWTEWLPKLKGTLKGRYSNLSDAEIDDILQEAGIRSVEAIDKFDPERGTIGQFLSTITNRKALDYLRKRGKSPLLTGAAGTEDDMLQAFADDAASTASKVMSEAEQVQAIRDAVASLDPAEQELVRRYYLSQEGTQEQVAKAMGIPVSTFKKRLAAGRQSLTGKLSPAGAAEAVAQAGATEAPVPRAPAELFTPSFVDDVLRGLDIPPELPSARNIEAPVPRDLPVAEASEPLRVPRETTDIPSSWRSVVGESPEIPSASIEAPAELPRSPEPGGQVAKGKPRTAAAEKLAEMKAVASNIPGSVAEDVEEVHTLYDAAFKEMARWYGGTADDYWKRLKFTNEAVDEATKARLAQDSNNIVQGAIDFLDNGDAVIQAFKHGNASTFIHEMGHFVRRNLKDADLQPIMKWAGAEKGWTREAEETFARGIEEYLRTGRLPRGVDRSGPVAQAFRKVVAMMKGIYRSAVAGISGVPREAKELFDGLFLGTGRPSARKTGERMDVFGRVGGRGLSDIPRPVSRAAQAVPDMPGPKSIPDVGAVAEGSSRAGVPWIPMDMAKQALAGDTAAEKVLSDLVRDGSGSAAQAWRWLNEERGAWPRRAAKETTGELPPKGPVAPEIPAAPGGGSIEPPAGPPPKGPGEIPDMPSGGRPEAVVADALPPDEALRRATLRLLENRDVTDDILAAMNEGTLEKIEHYTAAIRGEVANQGDELAKAGLLEEKKMLERRKQGYFPHLSHFYDNPNFRAMLNPAEWQATPDKKGVKPRLVRKAVSLHAQNLMQRNPVFWAFRDGTDGVNQFVKHFAGTKKTDELVRMAKGYVVPMEGKTLEEVAEDAADFVSRLPKELRGAQTPFVGREIYDDLHLYLQQTGRAIANAQAAKKLIASTASLDPVGVPLEKALKQINLKSGDVVLKDMLERNADELAAAGITTIEQLKKAHIPQDAIDAATRTVRNHAGQELNDFLRGWDKVTQWFKDSVTILWPAFHTRNGVSGVYQNYATGAFKKPGDATRYIKRAWDIYNGKGDPELMREIAIYNVGGRGYGIRGQGALATQQQFKVQPAVKPGGLGEAYRRFKSAGEREAGDVIDEATGEVLKKGGSKALAPLRNWKAAGQAGADAVEFVNRVSHYLARKDQGFAPFEAAQSAVAAHFNYSDSMSRFERTTLRRIVPFMTFARNNLPLQVSLLVDRPGGLTGQTIRAGRILREDATIPDYISGIATPLPGSEDNGSVRFLSGLGIPVEEAFERFGFGPGGARKTAEGHLGMLHPAIKAPLELLSGRQFFSGRDLEDLHSFPTGNILADEAIFNSPIARAVTTARTAIDPRKGLATKALNLGTGLRISDVDIERAAAAERRQRLRRLLEQSPNIRNVSILSPKKGTELSEEEQRLLGEYRKRTP